jgi:hypothetical protein
MAQFATAAELATYLRTTFDAAQTTAANQALTLASASIQADTNQRIEAVANETITFSVTPGTFQIVLPELPVTAVSAVSINGVALLAADYVLATTTGILRRLHTRAWGTTYESIVSITYSHGYATIPDAIKRECLRRAAGLFENPEGGSVLETAGPYSWRTTGQKEDGNESGTALDRYRVITVA